MQDEKKPRRRHRTEAGTEAPTRRSGCRGSPRKLDETCAKPRLKHRPRAAEAPAPAEQVPVAVRRRGPRGGRGGVAAADAAAAIAAGVRPADGGRGRGGDDEGGEELIEKLVHINRVSKTVKGGKRFGFAALVVVGDGKGRAGFGHGKAREVPEAISKATAAAKKAMVRVPLRDGRTLHHDGLGHFGAGRVYVRTAPAGTGIIAGGPMRAVFESLGVADVVTKSVGTSNPYNMIRATFEALKEQTSPRSVAQRAARRSPTCSAAAAPAPPKPRPRPKRSWSKRHGQDQDHPDRIADPPRRRPARDARRPGAQQDAPHGRSRGHARGPRPDPQGRSTS